MQPAGFDPYRPPGAGGGDPRDVAPAVLPAGVRRHVMDVTRGRVQWRRYSARLLVVTCLGLAVQAALAPPWMRLPVVVLMGLVFGAAHTRNFLRFRRLAADPGGTYELIESARVLRRAVKGYAPAEVLLAPGMSVVEGARGLSIRAGAGRYARHAIVPSVLTTYDEVRARIAELGPIARVGAVRWQLRMYRNFGRERLIDGADPALVDGELAAELVAVRTCAAPLGEGKRPVSVWGWMLRGVLVGLAMVVGLVFIILLFAPE